MRPVTLNLNGIKDPQVAAALMEIQRASQDTLQSDSSSPGAAMATVPFPPDSSFGPNTFAYFSQTGTNIRMAFAALTAFARSLLGLAGGTPGGIIVDSGAAWTEQVMGGDATMNASGAVTIANLQGSSVTSGTWTPVDGSGASLTFSNVSAAYTKIGNIVFAYGTVTYPNTSSSAVSVISGLPFAVPNARYAFGCGGLNYSASAAQFAEVNINTNPGTFSFYKSTGAASLNSNMSTTSPFFNIIYPIV
jgi:hypothetical protein